MPTTAFHAMGSRVTIIADMDSPEIRAILGEVRGWFLAWEACLSRFRSDSELSQLNQQAGRPLRLSPTLWAVLRQALKAAEHTTGLVTPAILPALEAAGYDKTFQKLDADERGEPHTIFESAPIGVDLRPISEIKLDPATRTVQLPEGMRLDLGGFAKGWAADQAARRIGKLTPVVVDAGGDIAVRGPRRDGQPWMIGIARPDDPTQHFAVIPITRGGVATSGRNYRTWQQAGIPQHHLIDPRTSRPTETDVLAATVIARSALEAEIAAKAVLILGSQQGLAWLKTRRGQRGIVVLENGQILKTLGD